MKRPMVSVAYLLGSLVLVFLVAGFVLPYIIPFILAVIVAALVDRPVAFLQRRMAISRGLAVIMVLLLVFGAVGTVIGIGIARLVSELFNLSGSLPGYYKQAETMVGEFTEWVSSVAATLPSPVQTLIEQQVGRLYSALEQVLLAILDRLKSLPTLIGILVVTMIASFFVSRDKDMLLKAFMRVVPGLGSEKVATARTQVIESTVGLFKAELTLVVITMVITTIALWFMGVEYALVIGLMTGLLDVLPVLGPGLVFVPWGIYSIVTTDVALGVMLLILYGVTSSVRQMLEAKLVGERIGVHPLVTLFSMYLGLEIFGPAGIIVGPFSAIIVKSLIDAGVFPGLPFSDEPADK
jgi:sporulation integral membrane protein YtvI